MISITLSETILRYCPNLHVTAIQCNVVNTASDERLWEQITAEATVIRNNLQLEDINHFPPIRATRQAYKQLGKDPNRYRPSAEALRRRILRGLPLYRIDTLVDIINLVSIHSGYSIGGFDAGKINGNLILGVGQPGEPYQAIGRGEMNIEGLPVYRDNTAGIGTPTSDEERTKIDIRTTKLLMIINGYSGLPGLVETARWASELLTGYVSASDINIRLIYPGGEQQEIVYNC